MHAARLQLQPHGIHIGRQRRLGHAVGSHEGHHDLAGQAADVDEVAGGEGDVVGDRLRELDGGKQVGIEIVLERRRRGSHDRRPARAADAEKQVIDPAEQPNRLPGHPIALAGLAEIGRDAVHGRRRFPRLFTGGEGPTNAIGRPAYQQHSGSLSSHVPSKHKAESGRSARHDHPATGPSVVCAGSCGHE